MQFIEREAETEHNPISADKRAQAASRSTWVSVAVNLVLTVAGHAHGQRQRHLNGRRREPLAATGAHERLHQVDIQIAQQAGFLPAPQVICRFSHERLPEIR